MTLFTIYQSVTVKNNSTIQDYFHSDDHTQPSYVIYDSWVKPLTIIQSSRKYSYPQ